MKKKHFFVCPKKTLLHDLWSFRIETYQLSGYKNGQTENHRRFNFFSLVAVLRNKKLFRREKVETAPEKKEAKNP